VAARAAAFDTSWYSTTSSTHATYWAYGCENSLVTTSSADITFRANEIVEYASHHQTTVRTNGAFVLEPYGAQFLRSLSWHGNWGSVVPESIRFGKEAQVENSTIDIYSYLPLVAKKSVELYSRNSYIYNHIRTLDPGNGTTGGIRLKSEQDIYVDSDDHIRTNGSPIVFWSDANADADGAIQLHHNNEVCSGFTTSCQATGGADIIMAGGTTFETRSNDYDLNRTVPTGFASGWGNSTYYNYTGSGYGGNGRTSGIYLGHGYNGFAVKVRSAGGDIRMYGKSTNNSGYSAGFGSGALAMGIFSGGTGTGGEIISGTGTIDMVGRCDAPVGTNYCRGVQLNAWANGNEDNFKIISNNPATD
jgi:hypothetical protein